jgi:DNA-directed RNA polymerase subunit M/transcription elongation factor TFIIS
MANERGQYKEEDKMMCGKCGSSYMVDDSYEGVKVYKCWACGNRLYVDHPKRSGSLVCSRCGDDVDTENVLGYCRSCSTHLNPHVEQMLVRTYGESTCACGTTFVRRSPRQLFHAKECRKRQALLHA